MAAAMAERGEEERKIVDGVVSSNNEGDLQEMQGEKLRNRKRKAFGNSGQTEEQRRVLRENFRSLRSRIGTKEYGTGISRGDDKENNNSNSNKKSRHDGDDDDDDDVGAFVETARDTNNRLFDKVNYTREAVLDSENVDVLCQEYIQLNERKLVKEQTPRFNVNELIAKLKESCPGPRAGFDWTTLGREAGVCFNAVPDRVSFFAGFLDGDNANELAEKRNERRQRALLKQQQIKKEEGEGKKVAVTRPDEVKAKEEGEGNKADRLSATEQTLKLIKKLLRANCKEQAKKSQGQDGCGPAELDGIKFLFNPRSFTQTVENIFHFSFMIKKGEAGIRIDDNGNLRVRSQVSPDDNGDGDDNNNGKVSKQAVLSFTMRDYKMLCEAYGLDKNNGGMIPHRRKGNINNGTTNN